MGSDTGLGDLLHVFGADLYLDVHPVRTKEHGVQGLIAVRLGDGDVILEFSRNRLVQVVDHAESAITGVDRFDDDAKGVDVEYLGEGEVLMVHLLVDAVEILLTPDDARGEIVVGEALLDGRLNLCDDLFAVAAHLAHRLGQHPVTQWIELPEAKFLKLRAHAVHTEAVGDRRIDIERLARDPPALLRRHGVHGTHVVQAVCQLDDDDADVLNHRQEHLAEVLRLGLLATAELDLGEFADAVDEFGYLGAKILGNLFLGGRGILYDVVQDRRHDTLGVESQ